jgi:hypothetical protein
MRRALISALMLFLLGCPFRKSNPEAGDASVMMTSPVEATPVASEAAVHDAQAPVHKAAATKPDAGHASTTTAMKPPTPTTDRFPRNRLKDGPCPAGFTEQPGVEEHSSCARNCKKDADCNGHTCVDSDIGDGKVCSDTASSAKPKPAAHTCKKDEIDDGERCYKQCTKDADCGKQKCASMMVPNPNGGTSTALTCQ